jgi:hypothetical protein
MTIVRPIWRTPVACGVIRVSGLTRVRFYCARDEVPVIVRWLRSGVDAARSELPVPEWGDDKTKWFERWTYRAADLAAECEPELLTGSTR